MDITVIKRDGTEEDFDIEKVSSSIMEAAIEVGGEDYELAEELADKIEEMLESNNMRQISTEELQVIVQNILIDEGHSATATAYIIFAAERNKRREMDTELMKSYEDITFSSGEDSDLKRENANINSDSAMGTMLKYGSEGAKKFNLMYVISLDVSNAHKDGDIHIHDLDFYTLTETCITEDTILVIRNNGVVKVIRAYELNRLLKDVDKVVVPDTNLEILSGGKFTKVINLVKHSSDGKRVLRIECKTGSIQVTDNHKVSVTDSDGNIIDKKAKDIKIGDKLVVPEINDEAYENRLESINLIDVVGPSDNVIIINTSDIIENLKSNSAWENACSRFDCKDKHYADIQSGTAKMNLSDYFLLQDLITVKHKDIILAYKKADNTNVDGITAITPLTKELGELMGHLLLDGCLNKSDTSDIIIHSWMYNANRDFIKGLVITMVGMDDDGNRLQYKSLSINLLKQLQELLLLNGIKSEIIKQTPDEEDGISTNFGCMEVERRYTLKLTGDSSDRYVEVTSISKVDYDGFVYDMETETHHFDINGFTVHNCCQIPLNILFKNGFNTGHGFLREPGNIRTAGALAAIAIQSNQNDQHKRVI